MDGAFLQGKGLCPSPTGGEIANCSDTHITIDHPSSPYDIALATPINKHPSSWHDFSLLTAPKNTFFSNAHGCTPAPIIPEMDRSVTETREASSLEKLVD